jgi:hypothetical protein
MKFYVIPPNNHLDMMSNGDRYFCLCHHFYNDADYRNYFLNLRKNSPHSFITLDNAAAEHSLVSQLQLLDAVEELRPNEVIPPDVLFDKSETIKNFYSFITKMEKRGLLDTTSLLGCPQGKNKHEWLECYILMSACPYVSCVGLSKIAVPKCWNQAEGDTLIATSRNQCVAELKSKNLLTKPIHLLGMGEHTEFDFYLKHQIPNIRSSDSCYTVLAAINEISFKSGNTTRIPTTNEYFSVTLTDDQQKIAKENIEYLKTSYKDV